MRGELIDLATTLKIICTKVLQEMVNSKPLEEEELEE
jgi:hypothetical protein